MPVVTFDDIPIVKDQNKAVSFNDIPAKNLPSNVVTFDDIPIVKSQQKESPIHENKSLSDKERAKRYGTISQTSWLRDQFNKLTRWGQVAAKTAVGDVPFIRESLPETVQKTKLVSEAEKKVAPLLTLARDIALWETGASLVGRLGSLFSKGTEIGEAAQTISRATAKATPTIGKVVSKLLPETAKQTTIGGIFGAATAGSEKPEEIIKHAKTIGAITGAIPPAVEVMGQAGKAVFGALGKSKTLTDLAEFLGAKSKENVVSKLALKRYGDINEELINSEVFLNKLRKQITPEEDRLLPYLIEKTNQKEIINQVGKKRFKELNKVAINTRKYLNEVHKKLITDYGDDVGFVKNYVPHIWDIPKNKEKEVVNWFVTRNPHLKRRLIPTIKEGIEKFGLTPKYDKLTDIIRVYDQIRIKSAANLKFLKDINKIKDETGVPVLLRADKAPSDWPTLDHPAIKRAFGHYVGQGKDKKLVLSKISVKVNPDMYDQVKAVLDTYQPGKYVKFLDNINRIAKTSVLTASLFHHMALTETGVAAGIGKEALKLWNPAKIIRAFKNGNYRSVIEKAPVSKRAVRAGVNLGAISDVEGGKLLVNVLKNAEEGLNDIVLSKGLKYGVRKPLEFNNKFLWDYLHTNFKLAAFEKLASDMKRMFPEFTQDQIDKEVAAFVNDVFGGQAWEILGKSKQWRTFSRFLLLSPDWVLSTMKQAVSPFGAGAHSKVTKEIREQLGKDFWRKAILYFGGGMNILNYAYTKAYTGKGRFMWENAPGKKTYLFTGYNDDGTERYMRTGKQFRELTEAIENPTKVAGRKISPLLRATKHQIFPDTQWQKDIAENEFWSVKGLKARVKQVLKDATPYSVSGQQRFGWQTPMGFIFPVSKGMTPYNTRKFFKKAIITKNKKLAIETYISALNNNLDPDVYLKQAISEIKSEKTFQEKQKSKDILARMKKLNMAERRAYLKKLISEGEITSGTAKQILKILQQNIIIKKKREAVKKMLISRRGN